MIEAGSDLRALACVLMGAIHSYGWRRYMEWIQIKFKIKEFFLGRARYKPCVRCGNPYHFTHEHNILD